MQGFHLTYTLSCSILKNRQDYIMFGKEVIMDRSGFGIDLELINKVKINTFKVIAPVTIKGISESFANISKLKEISEMQKNIAGISSVFNNLKNSIPQIDLGAIESLKDVTKSMSELSDTLNSNVSTYLKDIKIEGVADSIKGFHDVIRPIETWNLTNESLKVWNERLQSIIDTLPDEDYEVLLKDTGYTKEDVIEDFNSISDELANNPQSYQEEKNKADFNPKEAKEQLENNFSIKYPAAYIIIFLFINFFEILGKVDTINNVFVPFIQNSIVKIEGNQDKYFIKEEKVKVYESSSCHSKVLDIVYYGEEVEEIQDIKMWLEVSYVNENGIQCVGWIAKRNLVTYRDWQFNSDDIYDIK